MDPSNPESFNHRTELLSTGHTYHFVDQIPDNYDPKSSQTLLLIHGFPDFWYGWRDQIGPWVQQGARVVVPDMLGYGGTDKPFEPAEYSTKRLSADLAALLDLLEIQKAVVIGHDWGSLIAQRFAVWHPDRLSALVMISVAYIPPTPKYYSLQDVVRMAPNLGYQLYFESQKATKDIENNLHKFFSIIYKPASSPINMTPVGNAEQMINDPNFQVPQPILSEKELSHYLKEFSKGMNGPLNYYRTREYQYEDEKEANLPSELQTDVPVLFIWGTKDRTAIPSAIESSRKHIKRYEDISLEGVGHWVLVDAKVELAEKVANWLKSLK